LNPGPQGSIFFGASGSDRRAVAGGRWYFRAFTTISPSTLEVWTTDGTPAGTSILRTIHASASAVEPFYFPFFNLRTPSPMASLGGSLVLQASDGIASDLWKTDGTAAGTVPLADIYPGPTSGRPQELTALGGSMLFQATEETHGGELWATDGTAAGTGLLADLDNSPGTPGSFPEELTRLNGLILFRAGARLWKSDGTAAGTEALGDFSDPVGLERLDGTVLFAGRDGEGEELWRSDGTPEGTLLVKDIASGPASSSPGQITAAGSLAFFSAVEAATGRELWKTDGTYEGTALVKDIRPGPGDSIRLTWDSAARPEDRLVAVGATFFFPADDGAAGEELWKSDGTAAGTVLVRDVFPGPRSSEIRWLIAAGGRVFFVADDGVHGRELWVSDGTPAGTRLVLDFLPGPGSSVPQDLFALGHAVLFSATDGVHGRELWRSTGAPVGTWLVQDIAPGPLPASPMYFTPAGANVYFFANDGATGFELWAVPQAPLLTTFADVPAAHWAWSYVEALAAGGLTDGCAPGLYCPSQTVTRAEMATFIIRSIHGPGFVPPPATGTVFQDVPAGFWAAPWIERFAADGFTSGCSATPPLFCPETPVSRAQMAVFLLRARHGASYVPPPATGTVFQDVPAGYWAAAWIERLAAEAITAGCAPNLYCPENPVVRDAMAVFLVRAFNLPLP
ncbi:MAG TPA: ELWxxDGT repeat protein, partial [Thermoanaerobaculia bacterium]|nr:ELWxxDGT repeat protein [Thermoanaerobaculia bacterium]